MTAETTRSAEQPLISIIIPAHNERNSIAAALDSIKRQTYNRWEAIVVANACTDDTAKIAKSTGLCTVVETPQQGISNAKNMGSEIAKGEMRVFMDADSMAETDLLAEVIKVQNEGFNGGKAYVKPWDDQRFRAKLQCWSNYLAARTADRLPMILSTGFGCFTFLNQDLADRIKLPDGTLYDNRLQVMDDVDIEKRMRKHGKYKYITSSHIYTSMRRFIEEGYLKCLLEDAIAGMNPKGKTRKRWEK